MPHTPPLIHEFFVAFIAPTGMYTTTLNLEPTAWSPSPSALKLPSPRCDLGNCFASSVSGYTITFNDCTLRYAALQDNCCRTLWLFESELIECENFATSLGNALASSCCDVKCSNAEFRHIKQSWVVNNCTNNYCSLVGFVFHLPCQIRSGDWPLKGLAIEQSFQHNPVELGLSSARKEAEKLHQQPKVRVA